MRKRFCIFIMAALVAFVFIGNAVAQELKVVPKDSIVLPKDVLDVLRECPSGYTKTSVGDAPLVCEKKPPAKPCPSGYKYEAGPECSFKCTAAPPNKCNFKCPDGYMPVCTPCLAMCSQIPR
jgi:hypothetical protein